MVHLPLPEGIDTERIQSLIDVAKDVEGVNPANIGNVVYGRRSLVPCTALAVIEMIESTGVKLRGARCVCVGASNIVGKPIVVLLMRAEATVISTNKYTPDLAELARSADVLVSGAGVAGLIKADMAGKLAPAVDQRLLAYRAAPQNAATAAAAPAAMAAIARTLMCGESAASCLARPATSGNSTMPPTGSSKT